MIGILAEKPSQARSFAQALGGMKGTFNGEQYIIVPARGHLYGFIDDPSKQVPSALAAQYASWDLKNLPWDESHFLWKYTTKKDVKKELQAIRAGFANCDEICIGTDDDPTGEGELIAWEVFSNLKINAAKYTRMYFADESAKEVQKAFRNRKLLGTNLNCMYNDADYKQALFRTKWDYLSMQWTRVAANCSPYGQLPRQGRLKSAMVRLVGDQLELVKNYVKKPYYEARFKDENGVVYTNPDEQRFDDEKSVLIGNYHSSAVVCDSKTMKSTAPRKFLDLASLGGILAPKGVPAKVVLSTYQKMYENRLVSYPRTEDKCITIEQFNDLLPLVDKIAAVVGVDPKLLTHRTPRKTHVKTGMAHGANRPGPVVPPSLDTLDATYGLGAKLIYETLARNYLATLCEDYEYEQQKGHVKDYPKFVGTCNVPKKPGWHAVFGDMEDEEGEDGVSTNGLGANASPFVYAGANPKPVHPTMRWLMKQLEKYDVGTGATRTSIYADVTSTSSKYPLLVEKKSKLYMAPNGETSYILLADTHIGSLNMTETVMKQMKQVYEGKTNGDEFLHDIQTMVSEDMVVMQNNSKKLKNVGGGSMASQKDRYQGTWKNKSVSFVREWSGHYFTDAECERLCNGEEIEIEAVSAKTGKPYTVKGSLETQKFNNHTFVGFKPNFNTNVSKKGVPKSFCGHDFTDGEIGMLEMGKEVFVRGFMSKKGNVFDAYVSYGEKEDGKKGFIMNFNKK